MTDLPDPMDQPEDEGMELAVPFIVCQSQGGPYEDESFVAGYQAGRIDMALAAAASVGAKSATYTVMTTLVKQLELIGMHRGFPNVTAEQPEEAPEWSFVTFSASEEAL